MVTSGGDGVAGRVLGMAATVWRAALTGVIEVGAAAVDPPAGDVPAPLPDLDRLGGDSELGGDLLEREHACGSEPLVVGANAAVPAQLGERGNGERVTPPAGQSLVVEDLDRLVIGVLRRAVRRSA